MNFRYAKPKRRLHRLIRYITGRDRSSQANRCSDGVNERSVAAILLMKYQRQQLNTSEIHALCLLVHHGGSAHDIRTACHIGITKGNLDASLRQQMIDRILIMKHGFQVHGTQYRSNARGELLERFPMVSVSWWKVRPSFGDHDRTAEPPLRLTLTWNPNIYVCGKAACSYSWPCSDYGFLPADVCQNIRRLESPWRLDKIQLPQ